MHVWRGGTIACVLASSQEENVVSFAGLLRGVMHGRCRQEGASTRQIGQQTQEFAEDTGAG
jgi:hypothetical protein